MNPVQDGAETIPDSPVETRLKWFNAAKGFGFVVPESQKTDAFLHITTLRRARVDTLGEGARLLCLITHNAKGALQVKDVVAILDVGRCPEPLRSACPGDVYADTLQLTGTVKWYKPEKGFGFVAADDGGKDIFLPKKRLRRYGLDTIEPRTPLMMTVGLTQKGREVIDFEILD